MTQMLSNPLAFLRSGLAGDRSETKCKLFNASKMPVKVFHPLLQDFRYMATSDLIEMLKDPVWKQDPDTERRLCDQIVAQLDDSSSDVSSLAVKWCG